MKKTLSAIIAILTILVLASCDPTPKDPLEYGTAVAKVSIVYEPLNGGRIENCATELEKALDGLATVTVTKSTDPYSSDAAEGTLLVYIGNTGSEQSIEAAKSFFTPMDYIIRIKDGKAAILGYTGFATAAATEKFIELVKDNPKLLSCRDYTYSYFFDLRNISPYCWDVSSFHPKWEGSYSFPGWMQNIYEKMYALTHYNSPRPVAFAHRGDFTYYPNGSIEGVISACMAGADIVEIDFRLTKDNIPVMLHEEDLSYLTDVAKKKGKNGLPESTMVGDWTYDQLMKLDLNKATYGKTYKIATCYEVLLVARQFGTMLTWDDKADETERPVFAATTSTKLEDMLPLMLHTDTLHYFLYYYAHYKGYLKKLDSFDLPGTSDVFKKYLEYFKDCVADTLKTYKKLPAPGEPWSWNPSWGYSTQQESEYWWNLWFEEEGHDRFWSNTIVPLCDWIGRNYGPTDYKSLL